MTELAYFTASELAPLIKGKQLSPVEVTEAVLNRMKMIEPKINAYITTLHDLALQQARCAEKEIMNNFYRGPLHGIPIGIKDNFHTRGIRTTIGSKMLCDFLPAINATMIEKILRSGGVMMGKLNCDAFAIGATNINPFYGSPRNPWNLEHVTGGSSGGSAAALAAGLTILATGTDTYGSIRNPASMCGIYGIKPTYGLVSKYGVTPTAWSMDHVGPMARSVPDLALMLNHMAGYDVNDPASIKADVPNYSKQLNKGIEGLRIGIPDIFLRDLEPVVEQAFRQAVRKLEALGAIVVDVDIPALDMTTYAGYIIVMGEAASYHRGMLQANPEGFRTDNRIQLETGMLTTTPQYLESQQIRRVLVKAFKKVFTEVDVLAGPSIPITAPRFETNWVEENLETTKRCMPFTVPANLAAIPSLSVPIGLSSESLPIGMQFMGNHLSEKLLLQLGYAWECTDPLDEKIPVLA